MKMLKLVDNKNFIGGKWVESASVIPVVNPAAGTPIGGVPNMAAGDITKAIDNTVESFAIWAKTTPDQRAAFLIKWHQLILDNLPELAHVLTLEQGKPLADAKGEIIYAASFVQWFAAIILTTSGHIKTGNNSTHKIITEYEPIGPAAAITPWNFPCAMITRKISPALAAGCSVLLKPSSLTPFSALLLARLAEEAGLPAGILNVVTGDSNLIGKMICDDFRIRKLSFTGSTNVGKILYQNSAATLKKLSLELGGNSPYIIFSDSDLDKTVADLIIAKTRSSGQSCISPNRIFIQDIFYDKFLAALTQKFSKLKVGDGMDPSSDIGPLINRAAGDKVKHLLEEATKKGAKIICGGKVTGNFVEPTIIIDCRDDMEIFATEIFGPVIACYKFSSDQEVIKRSNNTEYGLQAYLYTADIGAANKIATQLDFGMVSINSPLPSNTKAPFGGRKASGFGVEGSTVGIMEYLNIKYINLQS